MTFQKGQARFPGSGGQKGRHQRPARALAAILEARFVTVEQLPDVAHAADGRTELRWLDYRKLLTEAERRELIRALVSPWGQADERRCLLEPPCQDNTSKE